MAAVGGLGRKIRSQKCVAENIRLFVAPNPAQRIHLKRAPRHIGIERGKFITPQIERNPYLAKLLLQHRGHYSDARLDTLLNDAVENEDTAKRREDYVEAQQILGRDLPAINLWYLDTIVVHNRRLTNMVPAPTGSYAFLETAELVR